MIKLAWQDLSEMPEPARTQHLYLLYVVGLLGEPHLISSVPALPISWVQTQVHLILQPPTSGIAG